VTLLVAMIVVLLGVAGSVATFVLLEAIALRNKTDDLFTLSTYWKWARARHPVARIVLDVACVSLCLALAALSVWLFGHLVLEAW
jgi:hypothetical protein